MARPVRANPFELTDSWPESPSSTAAGEVARKFALNLQSAIGSRSLRAAAEECDLVHVTLASVLEGRTWPDLETIAKLEIGLGVGLWPDAPARGRDNSPS
jgi:hypothetical protein